MTSIILYNFKRSNQVFMHCNYGAGSLLLCIIIHIIIIILLQMMLSDGCQYGDGVINHFVVMTFYNIATCDIDALK